MVPVGQILKENFAGLEWGDELKSLNHELSSFSLHRANTNMNGSPPFLTDPNESISHSDEALGLEFASSIPFVSTPTPAQLPTFLSTKTDSGFQENSSDLYNLSGGFENSGFRFHGAGNNERTFSSSSNSSNTSFISEGSFSNILRTSQGDGFRDSGGLLTASTPYRGEQFGGNEGLGSRSNSGREDNSFGYSGNSFQQDQIPSDVETPHRRWNFLEHSVPPTTPSRSLNHGNDQGGRFLGSPHSSKPPGMYNNMSSDFTSLLESLNQLEGSPKASTSFGGNSIWSSPSTGTGNQNQPQQWSNGMLPPGLSAKQTVQCLQILQDILDECMEVGDSARATQTCALKQMLQQHLLSELVSPTSPTRSPGVVTPTETTMDRMERMDRMDRSVDRMDRPVERMERSVDRTAKSYRDVAGIADATFTWSGQLPPRIHRNPTYSCKVFLGGVPWDITEGALISAFKPFGNVKIEWPGKEGVPSQPKGYAYAIFEHEKQIKLLLQNCTHDYSSSRAGNWYYKISSKRMRGKDVQVIPWALSDSNYVKCQATKLDGKKTIFVGALHGMLNAEGLAKIMNDLFGGVIYAGIDTDRHKYPIGSGRLTFNNNKSYMKAVSAAFVEIKTSKFGKKVQVDPYLEDATCSICNLQQAPYFCREWCCFRYFCRTCYQVQHSGEAFRSHRPLMRNASKPQGTVGPVIAANFSLDGNHGVNSSNISSNGSYSSCSGFQRRYESANNTRFSQMR